MTESLDELLVVFRGGGDLATGAAWRLERAGIGVIVCELAFPLTVRRTVAFSTAVLDGSVVVEGVTGVLASLEEAKALAQSRDLLPVVVSPGLPPYGADVVVDARLAKRPLDTRIDDAPFVVGLGPGFTAGVNCHAVVETMRGPRLGRVIWQGAAAPNTGTPGIVEGRGSERVLRAPSDGTIRWRARIGDAVSAHAVLGTVGSATITAPFAGVVRGLIADGTRVSRGCKVGDVDPRLSTDVAEISDKALAVGGGVLEAILTWFSRRGPGPGTQQQARAPRRRCDRAPARRRA